ICVYWNLVPHALHSFPTLRSSDLLSIHLDRDLVPLDDNVLREPLVVFSRRFTKVFQRVYTPRPAPIRMRVVNLYFNTLLGPSFFLVFRMHIHSGIGARRCHDIGLPFKIGEMMICHFTHVKQVCPRTMSYDSIIDDRKRLRVLIHLPAVQRSSIKEADPAVVLT